MTSLIDLNGRVRNRAREERAERVKRLRRFGIGLVIFCLIAWVLTTSPLLSVRKVVVTGNSSVPTQAITDAAAVPLGTPLARVDAAAAEKRLAGLPGLGHADVSVGLPDTLKIVVRERTIAFVVANEAGFAWVDPSGVAFGQSSSQPSGYPLAKTDLTNAPLLGDVAVVVGALPASMVGKITEITAASRDSITIVLNEGKSKIVWGGAEASALKGQVATALAGSKAGCKLIDVSSPTYPTTTC